MPNVELELKKDPSSFRRIAIGTWQTAYDPSVYGQMEVEVDNCLDYIEKFREKTGRHLTMTHLMAKVAAACLAEMKDGNAILRFNRIYLRKTIGVFFQVAMKDPQTGEIDLSGATLFDVDRKSLVELVDEFVERTRKIRKAEDTELEKTRGTFKKIPSLMLNFVLKTISFLCYTLNLDLSAFGLPRDAFGSVMVTNIGSLGLDQAFVPLVPYSKVPLLIAVGAIRDVPVVRDGEVTVAKMMNLSATFDHRVLDGMHAAVMARVVREWFADPFGKFDDLDAVDAAGDPASG